MKKLIMAVTCLAMTASIIGCAQQAKTENSSEAIAQAKQLQSNEAQVKFLIAEANSFVSSQKFDEGIKTAQYILSNLDQKSQEAQSIIETAKAEIKKMAEAKVSEAKDDMKKKLGNLGQ